jgi:hypothetical protein
MKIINEVELKKTTNPREIMLGKIEGVLMKYYITIDGKCLDELVSLHLSSSTIEEIKKIQEEAIKEFVSVLYAQDWDYKSSINEKIRSVAERYLK